MCLLMLTKVLMLLITVCTFFSLLDQYVSHRFDVYHSSINSTRVVVMTRPSCSEPDSGINIPASLIVIDENTNPCFASFILPIGSFRFKIKPFLVRVTVQVTLWTNQWLPFLRTQKGGAVLPISDQRVQGIGWLVYDNKPEIFANLHTETDLGEWCVPIGR